MPDVNKGMYMEMNIALDLVTFGQKSNCVCVSTIPKSVAIDYPTIHDTSSVSLPPPQAQSIHLPTIVLPYLIKLQKTDVIMAVFMTGIIGLDITF